MTIDATTPSGLGLDAGTGVGGRHVGTAVDGTRIHLDTTTGLPIPDEALAAWRQAAMSGGLPEPSRPRWQQLRAGVVNMWEFDAAEYWSADGRAQFIGRNEQGKSTMMAMTTLTMLTGDLSPRYVDTFGDSHRTFRYYLEPTDDPKDRRPTDNQLNRGWTWVEYGRVTDDGPEYFTTLLFVQARRTSPDYTKKWVTHAGPERVRAGITLLHQNAVVPAADLTPQAGLNPHPSGKSYAKTVASTLFGLSDERLRTVVELLKTLRTPKLGNRLNPDWVIDRIREALPPVEAGEINELAEGWDQLGQLAADRDAAKEAQEAVTAYVKSTWNPWADATLRLAADDLVGAVTVLDDVTRDERQARARAQEAHEEYKRVQAEAEAVDTERTQVTQRRETLLQSQTYRDAADAGRQVTDADAALDTARKARSRAAEIQTSARGQQRAAQTAHASTEAAVSQAQERASAAVGTTSRAVHAAGLPVDSSAWAAQYETERLEAAVVERRAHVREAERLDRAAGQARNAAERDAQLLSAAEKEHEHRKSADTEASAAFDAEAQRMSDQLERWTQTIVGAGTVSPPADAVRVAWISAVLAECDRPRPVQRLAALIRDEWTQPAVAPLEVAATTADHQARAAESAAADLEAEATRIENEPTPTPALPHSWERRQRPASSAEGAPLWELLDPVDDLPAATVAAVEAALAGAGLLDAWVTPDGLWHPGRDGRDHVITLPNIDAGGPSLGDVLTLAEPVRDDGSLNALRDTTARVLATIGWRANVDDPRPEARTWVSGDGSWSSDVTSGQAVVPASGARLLGATARAQDRIRRAAACRDEAEQHRSRAQALTAEAAGHRESADAVRALGAQAPGDADLLGAGTERAAAHRELEKARTAWTARARTAEASQIAASEADAALLTFCSTKSIDPARLPAIVEALDRAANAVRALTHAAAELRHAAQLHQVRVDELDRAVRAVEDADREVTDVDRQVASAEVKLQAARDALDSTTQDVLDEATRLAARISKLGEKHKKLSGTIVDLTRQHTAAEKELESTEEKRRAAEQDRALRLDAWWVPVDAGLASVRGVALSDGSPRTLTEAVRQARALRSEKRPPRGWPDGAGIPGEREQIVSRLRDRLAGAEFLRLNSTLNRTGGRSAVVDHDDASGLPQVLVLVDASNARFDPAAAIEALADKAAQLGELHDEQMHKVMEELLASTFVDHLRDKVKQTEALLHDVNGVLTNHPTGTTRTVLRLRRKSVAEHAGGYQVLNRLLEGSVDSPAVQQQVQAFLAAQIRAAQDEGNAEGRDWKELLVDKLDYRRWFAVVTEWRVLASAKEGATQTWRELTRERHGQDSGGGKVMTMLQPLLATLATLYENSPTAPRPLWLDEAFDGVDAENTHSLLGMLVDFDFDFVLAGPKSLVASRHVPCAAVWTVNRAPAPMPGVDLGLWLYGAGAQEKVPLGQQTWAAPISTDELEGPDGQGAGTGEGTLWQ